MIVDVGVWLAAIWGRHVHHEKAAAWLDARDDELVICRVTQMGLLRLLTNRSVMGADVLDRAAAWSVLDSLLGDDRVVWREEPPGLEIVFRILSSGTDSSHKLWTDDYLAAFAQASNVSLVTLDRRMAARYPSVPVVTVGDSSAR